EIFGPVAPIVIFRTEDEAIRLANDTEYGLVSYVYTADLGRGLRVSEAIEAGMVGLNRGLVSDPAAPFGGVKESGLGREGGVEGLLAFTGSKYIAVSWRHSLPTMTASPASASIPNKSAIAEVERSSMKIVNIKRAAVAAVSLTALLAASACSGGGAAPSSASSGGGGGNSGYTFAMITHEVPGDTFWDR